MWNPVISRIVPRPHELNVIYCWEWLRYKICRFSGRKPSGYLIVKVLVPQSVQEFGTEWVWCPCVVEEIVFKVWFVHSVGPGEIEHLILLIPMWKVKSHRGTKLESEIIWLNEEQGHEALCHSWNKNTITGEENIGQTRGVIQQAMGDLVSAAINWELWLQVTNQHVPDTRPLDGTTWLLSLNISQVYMYIDLGWLDFMDLPTSH